MTPFRAICTRLLDDLCRLGPLLALVHTSSPCAPTAPAEIDRRNPAWPPSSPVSPPAAPLSPSF